MIDEVYIRMCREAVEIQEGWEPRDGDQVSYWMKYWMKNYGVIEFTEILHGCGGEVVDEIGHPIKNCQNVVWLPRQEDLQKIYAENHSFTTWGIIEEFYKFFKSKCAVCNVSNRLNANENLNVVWLCFVMETVYNKQWNMETQTWEKIQ